MRKGSCCGDAKDFKDDVARAGYAVRGAAENVARGAFHTPGPVGSLPSFWPTEPAGSLASRSDRRLPISLRPSNGPGAEQASAQPNEGNPIRRPTGHPKWIPTPEHTNGRPIRSPSPLSDEFQTRITPQSRASCRSHDLISASMQSMHDSPSSHSSLCTIHVLQIPQRRTCMHT